MSTAPTDYYEFLQISPNADADTIHRVYRFLAARLHPDNIETGHAENFQLLKKAYDVLSDPARRAEYDSKRRQDAPPQQPISSTVDFMDVARRRSEPAIGGTGGSLLQAAYNSEFP